MWAQARTHPEKPGSAYNSAGLLGGRLLFYGILTDFNIFLFIHYKKEHYKSLTITQGGNLNNKISI